MLAGLGAPAYNGSMGTQTTPLGLPALPWRMRYMSAQRAYQMGVDVDLLGGFVLQRRWSGLRNRRGGGKQQHFVRRSELLHEMRRIHRLRLRHGYEVIEGEPIAALLMQERLPQRSESPPANAPARLRLSRLLKKAAHQRLALPGNGWSQAELWPCEHLSTETVGT